MVTPGIGVAGISIVFSARGNSSLRCVRVSRCPIRQSVPDTSEKTLDKGAGCGILHLSTEDESDERIHL
jgi:hypothetical protein